MRMAVGIVLSAADDGVGRHNLPQKDIRRGRVAAMMADFEHRGGQVLPAVGHIVFGRPFRVARKQESRLPIRDPDDERKIVHIVVNAQRREEFDLRAAE